MTWLMIAAILLLSMTLSFIGLKIAPEWKDQVPWTHLMFISGASAGIVGVSSYLIGRSLLPSLAIILLVWLFPTIIYTDYKLYLIPRGITMLTLPFAIALIIADTFTLHSFTPFIMVAVSLVFPLILIFLRGIGMGDIRLLVLFSLALPWWIGTQRMITAIFLSVGIQLLSFAIGKIYGKGKMRTVKGLDGKEKQKMSLPFGPALLAGFILISLLAISSPVDCSSALTCVGVPVL